MKFDFTNTELSAEVKAALAAPDVIAAMDTLSEADMGTQITARVAAEMVAKTNEFNTSKQTFKTNMDALDAKLKTAEADLKTAIDKGTGSVDQDAFNAAKLKVTTLEGQIVELRTESDGYKTNYENAARSLQTSDKRATIRTAITKFNKDHPEINVVPDAVELIDMLSDKYVENDDKGGYAIKRFDGNPLTTAEGLGTVGDWLNHLHTEKPSFFASPKGSGAPGSQSGGAGGKTITRTDFEALSPGDRANIAKTHTLVD